jgi:hypothetical protein
MNMLDILFITTAFGFFPISIGDTHACEPLRGGNND